MSIILQIMSAVVERREEVIEGRSEGGHNLSRNILLCPIPAPTSSWNHHHNYSVSSWSFPFLGFSKFFSGWVICWCLPISFYSGLPSSMTEHLQILPVTMRFFSSIFTVDIWLPPSSPLSFFKHNVTTPMASVIIEP